MSHHYSGPDFGFPHGDARLDLTDLYAFPKPGEADKSILIMNVHPSAVVNPPGPTTRRAVCARGVVRAQDRHGRRCRRRHRIPGALLVLRGRVANRDGAPRRGRAGRRDGRRRSGHHRSSTCLDWSGRARDGGRRLPLLRGLAQRSLLLRHAGGA